MSTAEFPYRVLIDPTDVVDATKPLDAFVSRIIMSNLNHMADEFAQVRVKYAPTAASLSGKVGYLTSRTPTAINTPYAVSSWTFPINVRADGRSYRLRVRLGGATGNAAAAATFIAVLSPGREAPALTAAAVDSVYVSSATSSTTQAWLAGTSLGPNGYKQMMEMTPAEVALCYADFPTNVDLAGDPATVRLPWVTLTIFAQTTNVLYTPRLYGVEAQEVIGLT